MTTRPSQLVLLGHPVGRSLSPTFQNAALRHAGLPQHYRALDVPPPAFADTFRALVASGAAGNVTVPHKHAAAALCDELTPLAARAGAVNTFWTDDGRVFGDNTDVGGFDTAVRSLLSRAPANQRVALLGAGGAATAVLAAVERWPNSYVAIWNRTPARATNLATRFASFAHADGSLDGAVRDATLVVNATSVGLADDDLPISVDRLPKRAAAIDLVYRRGGTPWVRELRARRRAAVDGLPMLIEQGALAFERWFGIAPDRDVMWSAVR